MRVKTGTVRHQKHHQLIKSNRGYRMTKNRLYKVAKEASLHAGQYAFHGRKLRKRNFRTLWIQRIKAALFATDLKYSRFIAALGSKKIVLNRKILAELAVRHQEVFLQLVNRVK
ncbi:MAG: 50S ribosomal protein L20 [Patescibacteria group bacterium]